MFANIHVKTRLYAGFMVLLALLALVAAASIWVFSATSGHFHTFGDSSVQAINAVQLDRQILAFNNRVNSYVQAPTEDAAAVVMKDSKALADSLHRFRGEIEDPRVAGHVDKIVKAFDAYSAQLEPAMDYVSQRTVLITQTLVPLSADLVEHVQKVRDATTSLEEAKVAGRLGQHLLQAQQAVDTYQQTHSEESFAQAWEFLFKVDDDIAHLRDGLGLAADLYQAYQDALNALSATIGDIAVAQEELDKQGKIIANEAVQVKDLSLQQQRSIQNVSADQLAGAKAVVITLTILSLILGAGGAMVMGRSVVQPLLEMTSAMRSLAAGDKAVTIPATHRGDEIGQMAAAVQVFKDNAIEMDRMEQERVAAEAKATEDRRQAMLQLADVLEERVAGSVQMISESAADMQTSAQAMTATAEDTTRQASAVASATFQANTNVEMVASAAEELSAAIREIGEQVTMSAQVAYSAVEEARRASGQVTGLLEATDKIGEVVNMITAIAEQTNLLALNATIEAARAGEAGKGFAVVANEVKNLASQTGRATQQIIEQISTVQHATQDAVQAIQSITSVINRINEIAAAISAAVEEQGAATREIARNTHQAAQGTNSVSGTITEVSSAARETGDAASMVLQRATGLSDQADQLQQAVHDFLEHVRES
ncbi:methyl-accepting chemotaxis sensory transducer with TarH sensor [Insolitispirillum peregrinum]|uniref:Methyl-accepting chemotaxis sensory transducer with TarH sensor n=2 Tax=Insolitispirillum peregrinum TaxID=80876 RepID=A0A1N7PJL3_9PROT|nr:HAMP domain-containing methyl-accepting chemotaxis protein [Insolitispirillum peregrinum]SIT10815.1 methyl-accepting chemotaxis sensory transducer with TarH sensor [Insolitispirillum peregrinum]